MLRRTATAVTRRCPSGAPRRVWRRSTTSGQAGQHFGESTDGCKQVFERGGRRHRCGLLDELFHRGLCLGENLVVVHDEFGTLGACHTPSGLAPTRLLMRGHPP